MPFFAFNLGAGGTIAKNWTCGWRTYEFTKQEVEWEVCIYIYTYIYIYGNKLNGKWEVYIYIYNGKLNG